ncbi:MAG: PKD domain-containing protein, partial [Planctomycetes bacterium]|nr:PKD domain-containing protein [Planctomycetota bacterium]
ARGAERKFLVILAHSPKQYPNPNRVPLGKPPGGLTNKQSIYDQYFDQNPGNTVESFAEYWAEISYGEVTISGDAAGWIDLPWAIQPPLLNADDDSATGLPPVNDADLDDPDRRNSPASYFDLNESGRYEYGASELIQNEFRAVAVDLDGNPGGRDNGPFAPGFGSGDFAPYSGWDVWMPGERFVDMDDDNRWDGLDEARNQMDWNGDGMPDLAGPWIDLNGDGEPGNQGQCTYLRDSDNDGNPDCCPEGPTRTSCKGFPQESAAIACPSTRWAGVNDVEIVDCNGNLIPDACDISCTSAACVETGWLNRFLPEVDPARLRDVLNACGNSQDELPCQSSGRRCVRGPADGIPDECQRSLVSRCEQVCIGGSNHGNTCTLAAQCPGGTCITTQNAKGCVEQLGDPDSDACAEDRRPLCGPALTSRNPVRRCEFDDANLDRAADIPEPWENFLRRWDPCLTDPDAHADNFQEDRTHWIKVFDPNSPTVIRECKSGSRAGLTCVASADCPGGTCELVNRCNSGANAGRSCSTDTDCPGGGCVPADVPLTCFSPGFPPVYYRDDSYIRDNYPGFKVNQVVNQAIGRPLFGSHDPDDKITGTCTCASGAPCKNMGRCAATLGGNPVGAICDTDADCQGDSARPFCTKPANVRTLREMCFAGMHDQYDPPDQWREAESTDVPGGTTAHTTKMRGAPNGPVGEAFLIDEATPKPFWFEAAWQDRYVGGHAGEFLPGCAQDTFDATQGPGPTNPPFDVCQAPPWPGGNAVVENTPLVVPFLDVDEDLYDAEFNRRYFNANRGGLNGNGTGWLGCGALSSEVRFETGLTGDKGFVDACNHPILPEEADGADNPARFFDGWVEHDDLPSSKYHMSGDQRLGEVTSPYSASRTYLPPGVEAENAIQVSEIWGHDLGIGSSSGTPRDGIIAAAGPYATKIDGNNGRDGGNLLLMELLTWRTRPPFNNGAAWELDPYNGFRFHPYAGPVYGDNIGFRDYNLDGMIDQGETRFAGSENYQSDSNDVTTNDGIASEYPFNRQRLIEDCIEVLDEQIDFDDYVDPVSMAQAQCSGTLAAPYWLPVQLSNGEILDDPSDPSVQVQPNGVCSGIVLLPPGAHKQGDFNLAPIFRPIHNDDNDDASKDFPKAPGTTTPRGNHIGWNLFFHNLLIGLDIFAEGGTPTVGFQTAFAAHEYLHSWQNLPDLYDYDVYLPDQATENCPVGAWDIMANGGLVHPTPVLKESRCSQWIQPVDLTTVLTPGVVSTLTLPPVEFTRDNSYYYLENENRAGEKYWFWSAGEGFDDNMPGTGMLVMQTDLAGSPDDRPNQQASATHSTYRMIEADGLGQLNNCDNRGDAGDPWPGSTGNTRFNFSTVPAARWYAQNSWTGLEVQDIRRDTLSGSTLLTLSWQPTSVPSLRFINPPGGTSVALNDADGTVRYKVRFSATDVFGGTNVRLYYTTQGDEPDVTKLVQTATVIGERRKLTPGTLELSMDWKIAGKNNGVSFKLPDGRYFFFAELIPGLGADGTERAFSKPRPGRNNVGDGTLTVQDVNIAGKMARSETWTARCIKANGSEWTVSSSITQPGPGDGTPSPDPKTRAFTGQPYTSLNGAVRFLISTGAKAFTVGDTFNFTTTGITAVSQGVSIINGRITENPTPKIVAAPLSGKSPLTVTFDARASSDPAGQPLSFEWDFGDSSPPASGPQVVHTFTGSRTFTVTLRATNTVTSRFAETTVDIALTNNSPKAAISASPLSGPVPLLVQFSASSSSDTETPANKLIYAWDFGDGRGTAGSGVPGESVNVNYFYDRAGTYNAVLTVTDEGGRTDTESVTILVGNTLPEAVITNTALRGPSPWVVTFNAINSRDAENHKLTVTWKWGDGTPDETFPVTGPPGKTDGAVSHTYRISAGKTTEEFKTTAIVRDELNGAVTWPGVTVTVDQTVAGASDPRAIFSLTPANPRLNQEFTADGSASFDRPTGARPAKFTWSWGDNTPDSSGVTAKHTYTRVGSFTITLTVEDAETPPNKNSASKTVTISTVPDDDDDDGETGNRPPRASIRIEPPQGVVGTTFRFDASGSSDADGDDLTYRWSFGDGGTAEGVSVEHSYSAARTYVVRVSVRDEHDAVSDATRSVVVAESSGNRVPVAMIGTGPRSGAAPLTLTFNGQNSFDPDGDPLEYTWEFYLGDTLIATVTGAVVSRTFDSEGQYAVLLEVSDGRGGVNRTQPQAITVSAAAGPVDDGGDDAEPPGRPAPLPSRPPSVCGMGLIMSVLGSVLGMFAMAASRRRLRGH